MHDLQLISIMQSSRPPAPSRHNLAIQLHRNPVALHAKFFNQRIQRGRIVVTFFAIDYQPHANNIAEAYINNVPLL